MTVQPPPGYRFWTCDNCLASCNFEAMEWCHRRTDATAPCGFEHDQPGSMGVFEFIIRDTVSEKRSR